MANDNSYFRICPVCGKRFVPAVEHIYRTGDKSRLVCTYTCALRSEREHLARKYGKRERTNTDG